MTLQGRLATIWLRGGEMPDDEVPVTRSVSATTHVRSLFARPGVAMLIISSFVGNFALWGALFVGVQSLNVHGASVFAVQCTAIASFAPLLFGGALAGRYAGRLKRIDALRLVVVLLATSMAVLSLAMALHAPVTVVYVAAFIGGLGQVSNLTLLRPMLYEFAGTEGGPTSLAVDALGSSLAVCLGPLSMGVVMSVGGASAGYFLIAILFVVSRATLARVAPTVFVSRAPAGTPSPRRIRRPGLAGILGITIIVNLFYFPFQAIIPVVGERFTSAPALVGLLAAGPGVGMVLGNTVIALWRPARLGVVYVLGSSLSIVAMMLAVHAPRYGLTFVVLVLAGLGASGFSASQATLVLQASPTERRSQTMGLLSTAIGVLPLGTVAMGVLNKQLGVTPGVTISGVIGLASLLLWLPMCRPFLRGTHVYRVVAIDIPGKYLGAGLTDGDQ